MTPSPRGSGWDAPCSPRCGWRASSTLYALRTALAPAQTLKGLRRMVLDAAPVPGIIEITAGAGRTGN